MKKWMMVSVGSVLFIIGAVVIIVFMNRTNMEESKRIYLEELKENLAGTDKLKYLKNESFTILEVTGDGKSESIYQNDYGFIMEATLTTNFELLSNNQQFEFFDSIVSGRRFCGDEKFCGVERLMLKYEADVYEITMIPKANRNGEYHFKEMVVTKNDEAYTKEYVVPPAIQTNAGVSDEDVYQYMKAQYDQLTNYGETYEPDIHDPEVANRAADKFGISASETGQIYVEMEMNNAGY